MGLTTLHLWVYTDVHVAISVSSICFGRSVMPSCARSEIFRSGEVGVYHAWARCVRRAFLCGSDPHTNRDYEHRRSWIRDAQMLLAAQFGIEVGFRAEMSNHLHVVIRTRPDVVETWTDEEVVRRWLTVSLLAKSRDGTVKELSPVRVTAEMNRPGRVEELRQRLSNPSNFMGVLCEYISRRSNREDSCKGCFWEGRFGLRELTDEGAILVSGIYVDLNQIRAGETLTPETSTHTSAYDRIVTRAATEGLDISHETNGNQTSRAAWMCELTLSDQTAGDLQAETHLKSRTGLRASDKGLLSISLDDYLALLDVSGRIVRDDKSGSIPSELEPILKRLGVKANRWSSLISDFHEQFGHVAGKLETVVSRAQRAGRRWYRGKRNCASSFD